MVVRRLYSGNVIVNDYVVPAVKCRDIPMVVPRLSTFNSRDNVIIDYNIARIKTPDDHWYISTFYFRDYVIIIVNDYVVPDVKCRDIPMVVPRLYSGNVIVNDYVVLAVKCRDIPMVVRRLYSGNVIVNDYVVPDVNCQNKAAGRPLVYLYILQP
jgi:predicted dinucleotide-binding enzyme